MIGPPPIIDCVSCIEAIIAVSLNKVSGHLLLINACQSLLISTAADYGGDWRRKISAKGRQAAQGTYIAETMSFVFFFFLFSSKLKL